MANVVNKIKKYFEEVVSEMKKVSWPSKKQSWESMNVTLVVILLLTVYVGLADWLFVTLMKFIYTI